MVVMSRIGEIPTASRIRRSAALGAAIALAVALLAAIGFWLEDHVPSRTRWEAKLAFLLALEFAYGAIVVALLLATPVLAGSLFRARRKRRSRPAVARLLLLCCSTILILFASEGIAEAWWRRSHRTTVLRSGDSEIAPPNEEQPDLPAPPEQIKLPRVFADDGKACPVEVVVVGESSAAGVPYDMWVSMGSIVTWQLERLIPGRVLAHDPRVQRRDPGAAASEARHP